MKLLIALLLSCLGVNAQSYTYVVGQNLGLFDGRQLKQGESVLIPSGVNAYCIFQIVGSGVSIVNNGYWNPSQLAIEYGATVTNNNKLEATFIDVKNGRFINTAQTTLKNLPLAAGAFVENRFGSLLTVTNQFDVRGTFTNCGGLVVERYALYPSGVELSCQSGPPLPVELVSFAAENANGATLISWKIASELNADYYSVERSDNGVTFYSIGKVAASGKQDYQLKDKLNYQVVYYRLKSVDTNGDFKYSNVVSIAGSLVVSSIYYSELGQLINKPIYGFYIEVDTYKNGATESKKYFAQ